MNVASGNAIKRPPEIAILKFFVKIRQIEVSYALIGKNVSKLSRFFAFRKHNIARSGLHAQKFMSVDLAHHTTFL